MQRSMLEVGLRESGVWTGQDDILNLGFVEALPPQKLQSVTW